MKYAHPPYANYKRSDIDWSDVLPESWKRIRLRWGARIYAGGTPSKAVAEFWENGTIPWLNSGAVNQGTIQEYSALISQRAVESSSARWISKGNLVIALAGQGKTKGMVAELGIDATCNQSMAAIVPNVVFTPRYLLWWLTSNYENIRNMAGGDLRDGLNLELLGNISCPLPSLEEQKQIAAFLDYETAKIDALIEKQQQLIALLGEKRQAVISHAVTKGLNPHAPMRDSGVDGLGDVPEHWEVKRLKHVVDLFGRIGFRGYATSDIVDEGEGAIVLSSANITDGRFHLNNKVFLSWKKYHESPEIMVAPRDVLLVKTSWSFGKVAYIKSVETPMTVNPQVLVLKNSRIDSRYVAHFLQTEIVQSLITTINSGSYMPTMSQKNVGNLPMFMPTNEEAKEIADHIEMTWTKFDNLLRRQIEAIVLLQERRTALISAAVTGKIDVRGWKRPQNEQRLESETEVA